MNRSVETENGRSSQEKRPFQWANTELYTSVLAGLMPGERMVSVGGIDTKAGLDQLFALPALQSQAAGLEKVAVLVDPNAKHRIRPVGELLQLAERSPVTPQGTRTERLELGVHNPYGLPIKKYTSHLDANDGSSVDVQYWHKAGGDALYEAHGERRHDNFSTEEHVRYAIKNGGQEEVVELRSFTRNNETKYRLQVASSNEDARDNQVYPPTVPVKILTLRFTADKEGKLSVPEVSILDSAAANGSGAYLHGGSISYPESWNQSNRFSL